MANPASSLPSTANASVQQIVGMALGAMRSGRENSMPAPMVRRRRLPASTGAAPFAVPFVVQVLANQCVPLDAMGAGDGFDAPNPTPKVHCPSHYVDMGRVYASPVPAQVVTVKPVWNEAIGQLACDPVGQIAAIWPAENAVTVRIDGAGPQPAPSPVPEKTILVNLGPEANILRGSNPRSAPLQRAAVAHQPVVVPGAVSLAFSRFGAAWDAA